MIDMGAFVPEKGLPKPYLLTQGSMQSRSNPDIYDFRFGASGVGFRVWGLGLGSGYRVWV